MDEATEAMGLGAIGGISSRAFSRDVLSIQIGGPDRPQLTLVDLPGLIHSTNRSQTEADKILILDLVQEYMRNERTIILAVVSAKNDFANQIVLDHARKADKTENRTLGIITKPDYLLESSENEMSWIELAQNKDIYLKRGWHMLKNRGEGQGDYTFAERNADEKLFFSRGRYVDLPRECVGVETLRERLSKVLLNHLIQELPSLKQEIQNKFQDTKTDIAKLGESRKTFEEQRRELMKVSVQFYDILKSATKGYYENPFFGAVDMNADVHSVENVRRFRAVIQDLNMKFAENMRRQGHKFAIAADPGDDKDAADEDGDTQLPVEDEGSQKISFLRRPKVLSRKEGVEWVKKTLVRTRGFELPGTFQPMLISQLFWEQSQPWETIALDHISEVARVCKQFVFAALNHSAPKEFVEKLATLTVNMALKGALDDAQNELEKLIRDKSRHPMTYNRK